MPDIFPDNHIVHIAPNAQEHINTKGALPLMCRGTGIGFCAVDRQCQHRERDMKYLRSEDYQSLMRGCAAESVIPMGCLAALFAPPSREPLLAVVGMSTDVVVRRCLAKRQLQDFNYNLHSSVSPSTTLTLLRLVLRLAYVPYGFGIGERHATIFEDRRPHCNVLGIGECADSRSDERSLACTGCRECRIDADLARS